MSAGTRQVILDHTSVNGAVARHVRGSLIASSQQTLREVGLYERYMALLAPEHREQVLYVLASSWLPMPAAAAHYQACDDLKLDDATMNSIGEAVSQRIMGTYLGTMMRSGRNLGTLSPWLPFHQYHRVCERIVDGGTFIVTEVGPKDALVETRGLPLFRYRYFRTAALGIFRGAAGMFAKKVYVRELSVKNPSEQLLVSVSWV